MRKITPPQMIVINSQLRNGASASAVLWRQSSSSPLLVSYNDSVVTSSGKAAVSSYALQIPTSCKSSIKQHKRNVETKKLQSTSGKVVNA